MGKFQRIRKRVKTNLKAYKFGLSNIGNLTRFMKVAPSDEETKNVPSMTVFEAKEKIDKNALYVIDVRSEGDFANAHIEGSRQMTIFEFEDESIYDSFPKDGEIGVLCYGGGASMTITQMLVNKGFDAKNIEGGIIRYALDVDTKLLGDL